MKFIKTLIAFFASFFASKAVNTKEHLQWVGGGKRDTNQLENWSPKEKKRAIENGNLDLAMERASDLEHLQNNAVVVESFETYEAMDEGHYEGVEGLDNLLDTLETLCHQEGLDSLEDYENIDYARRNRILGNMVRKHGRRGGVFTSHQLGQRGLTGTFAHVAATVTVVISRLSYNLAFALPVEAFNYLDSVSGYNLIAKNCPAGVTFVGAVVQPSGSIIFTYNDTATHTIVDTVQISCQEVPYNMLLTGTQTTILQTGGGPNKSPSGTIQLSDPTQAQLQYSQQWIFTHRNIFGSDTSNPLASGLFFSSDQFQNGILDMKVTFPIDNERGFIYNCAYVPGAAPGYQLQSTFFFTFQHVKHHNVHAHPASYGGGIRGRVAMRKAMGGKGLLGLRR